MKRIKSEIEQYMIGPTKGDGPLTSRFVFPGEFTGFQGHFPSKKVLPGVCQIQCALSTLEKGNKKAVVLKEVVLAKYFTPSFPDEELTCVVSCGKDARGEVIVKALITKNDVKISELKLRVSFADKEGNS